MTAEKLNIQGMTELEIRKISQVGFWSAMSTAVITIFTFSLAIMAVPISGANCIEGCIEYPYLDTLGQFPKDYRWMVPAMFLVISYLIFMISIHAFAPQSKKIFSQIGLALAIMSAIVLLSDYFLQFSIIPISLINRETEGITMITQYNPHGVFIALEELGYLLMSLSFLFFAPVFTYKHQLEAAVRWIFMLGFLFTVAAFMSVTLNYGLDRQDRFEIAVISIDWLVLAVNGIIMSILFMRQLNQKRLSGSII